MKAYKLFKHNWTCNGYQFEVGKTYEHEGDIKLCEKGFHACTKLEDCFKYYKAVSWNKIAEVEILGDVKKADDDSKVVTNKIRIVKEILWNGISNDIRGGNYISGGNYIWGARNSYGVDQAIFIADKKRQPTIFGKKVTEKRFNEVWEKLNSFDWYPKFNNAVEFYVQKGHNWELVPADEIKPVTIKEAWASMPKEMLEYIKSLKEFNKKIFTRITEIEI